MPPRASQRYPKSARLQHSIHAMAPSFCPFRLRVAAGWPSFAAPRLLFSKNCFVGASNRGDAVHHPPGFAALRSGAGCPALFGYLLSPLSREKMVAASARTLSLKESAAGGRSTFRGSQCALYTILYTVWGPGAEVNIFKFFESHLLSCLIPQRGLAYRGPR